MKVLILSVGVIGLFALLAGSGTTMQPERRDKAQPPAPSIKLKDESGSAVDVTGLQAKDLEALKKGKRTPEEWTALFAVYVDRGDKAERKEQAPLLGTYHIEED